MEEHVSKCALRLRVLLLRCQAEKMPRLLPFRLRGGAVVGVLDVLYTYTSRGVRPLARQRKGRV